MSRGKKGAPALKRQARAIGSAQSLSSFVKSICDVMRRSNCASALQYVPELTWILFLRILDAQEARDQEKAEAVGATFTPALRSPYRWQDWAAPYSDKPDHPRTLSFAKAEAGRIAMNMINHYGDEATRIFRV